MSDEYLIDSHKLIYHPGRVSQWLEAGDDWDKNKTIYPLYVEISPSGICNHRCSFCAMDYIGYKPEFLSTSVMDAVFSDMSANGVKSVMFAGEGEPLLNKSIGEMAMSAKKSGLDIAFTTNGVMLNETLARTLLPLTSWIKVSLDAGKEDTYSQIHGTGKSDFYKVLTNLKDAVSYRNTQNLSCVIGAQVLLLPENAEEIETLAKLCRDDLGLDYLVVKPYSHNPRSITEEYNNIEYSDYEKLDSDIKKLNSEHFKAFFRFVG